MPGDAATRTPIGVYVFEDRDEVCHAWRRGMGDRYLCGQEHHDDDHQRADMAHRIGLYSEAQFLYFRLWRPCERCVAVLKDEAAQRHASQQLAASSPSPERPE